MAESESNRLISSMSVMSLVLIRAICTNGLGLWLESASTAQANQSWSPARVAPVMRGSARSNHRRPSGVREIYPLVPIQRAVGTSFELGDGCFSGHENTASVLVSRWAAK